MNGVHSVPCSHGRRLPPPLVSLLVALGLSAYATTVIAADSVYWGTNGAGTIRVANLDGTGTASTLFAGEGGPCGVAIDPSAGKIYWVNFNSNTVRVGNLDGTGTASTLFTEAGSLCGVAIDPTAGKIYWANFGSDTIRVGNLDGSGSASTLFTESAGSAPRRGNRPRGRQDLLDQSVLR